MEPQGKRAGDLFLDVLEIGARSEHGARLVAQNGRPLQDRRRGARSDDRDTPFEGPAAFGVDPNTTRGWLDMPHSHAGVEAGATVHGASQDDFVQVAAGDHQRAVLGRDVRRGSLTVWRHHLVGPDSATFALDLREDAHLVEHAQRTRRQAIAARLVAREVSPVQQQDVESAATQEVRGGRTAGPSAYDHRVVHAADYRVLRQRLRPNQTYQMGLAINPASTAGASTSGLDVSSTIRRARYTAMSSTAVM